MDIVVHFRGVAGGVGLEGFSGFQGMLRVREVKLLKNVVVM